MPTGVSKNMFHCVNYGSALQGGYVLLPAPTPARHHHPDTVNNIRPHLDKAVVVPITVIAAREAATSSQIRTDRAGSRNRRRGAGQEGLLNSMTTGVAGSKRLLIAKSPSLAHSASPFACLGRHLPLDHARPSSEASVAQARPSHGALRLAKARGATAAAHCSSRLALVQSTTPLESGTLPMNR